VSLRGQLELEGPGHKLEAVTVQSLRLNVEIHAVAAKHNLNISELEFVSASSS